MNSKLSTGEQASAGPSPSTCSVCGSRRIALNRENTKFGACMAVDCPDPLKDYRAESIGDESPAPATPKVEVVRSGFGEFEMSTLKEGERVAASGKHDGGWVVERAAAPPEPAEQDANDPATETRWQDAIYELCKKSVGSENDHLIDGGGSDSGDALDFTLSEIGQAIGFWQDEAAASRLRLERLEGALRDQKLWLEHYLTHYVVSVQTKDEKGYIVNGFAAIQIPDWAVRQKLDGIVEALGGEVSR